MEAILAGVTLHAMRHAKDTVISRVLHYALMSVAVTAQTSVVHT